jgi:hypothetical protein
MRLVSFRKHFKSLRILGGTLGMAKLCDLQELDGWLVRLR